MTVFLDQSSLLETNITEKERSTDIRNKNLVPDPTIELPGFDLPRCQWTTVNHNRIFTTKWLAFSQLNIYISFHIYILEFASKSCSTLSFLEFDACVNSPCQNSGTCYWERTYYSCSCSRDFSGENCERGKLLFLQT